MSSTVIDLRSDTVTRPTEAMREAMARAPVGDDTLEGDPTTRRLEERVAGLLGKDRALFFPSGIMANQTALAVLSAPGTEVVLEASAHIVEYEEGAAAQFSGLQLRTVATVDGVMTAEAVEGAIRPVSPYLPRTSILSIENTHMGSGGRVQPQDAVERAADVARRHGVAVHLDGARLWHAAVASGSSPAALAAPADTVMVSLSKGLGAPVGSMLAGPAPVMEEAWRIRRRMGGGMRQSGVLAAAGLHALDHHVDRMEEDHERARTLARKLDGVAGVEVVPPETNVVLMDLGDDDRKERVLAELNDRGVWLSRLGPGRLRTVTHLDVDDGAVGRAVEVIAEVLEELEEPEAEK
ncbi:MAG: threonine aldolase family protein [Gemmatimonadota bacterium]